MVYQGSGLLGQHMVLYTAMFVTLVTSEWNIPGVPVSSIHLCDSLVDTISCPTDHFLWVDSAFLGYSPNYTVIEGVTSCPNTPESCLGPAPEVDRCTSYRSCETLSVPQGEAVVCDETETEEIVNFLTLNYACMNEADYDFTDMCSAVNTTLSDVMLTLPNWPAGAPDEPLSCNCFLSPEGTNQDITVRVHIFFVDLTGEENAEEILFTDEEDGTEIFRIFSSFYLKDYLTPSSWTSSSMALRFRKDRTTTTEDWKTKIWMGMSGSETFRLICDQEDVVEPSAYSTSTPSTLQPTGVSPWYQEYLIEVVAGACGFLVIIITILVIIVYCSKRRLKRRPSRMPLDPLPQPPLTDAIYTVIPADALPPKPIADSDVRADIYLNTATVDKYPKPGTNDIYLKPLTNHPLPPDNDVMRQSPADSMESIPQVSAPGTPRAVRNVYQTGGLYLQVTDDPRTADNSDGYVIAIPP